MAVNIAKRPKLSDENDWIILDYLNEDCWRHILDYVPVHDILRTERTSRRWQGVVLTYLQGVHISILSVQDDKRKRTHSTCILEPSKFKSFELWTNKLGSLVVATFCNNWEEVKTIGQKCPNLEILRLLGIEDYGTEIFSQNQNECFKCLRKLCFHSCPVSDRCVSQFINDIALEELEFYDCTKLTGQCLNTINTSKLKSLVFRFVYANRKCDLNSKIMVSATERLAGLTQLTLANLDGFFVEEMQEVFDKMPKLERLIVFSDGKTPLYEPELVSSLTRLKHITVNFSLNLEAVTRCCKELETLEILYPYGNSGITSDDMEMVAQYGKRLKLLAVHGFFDLEDRGVVALIHGCLELKWLKLNGSSFLTPAVLARAQAAWRASRPGRRLRLDLRDNNLDDEERFLEDVHEEEEIQEKTRQYREMREKYESLVLVLKPEGEDEDEDEDEGDYELEWKN